MPLWAAHAVFVGLYAFVAWWDGPGEPGAFAGTWAAALAVCAFAASLGVGPLLADPTARLFARCQCAEIPGLLAVLAWRSGAPRTWLVGGLVLSAVAFAACVPRYRPSGR